MKTLFESYFKPKKALEDILQHNVEIGLWEYDSENTSFRSQGFTTVHIPHVISTPTTHHHEIEKIEEAVETYRLAVQEHVEQHINKLPKKAQEKKALYEEFLENIHQHIHLSEEILLAPRFETSCYQLTTPAFPKAFTNKLQVFFQTQYSHSRTIRRALAHPFGTLIEQQGQLIPSGQRLPVNILVTSPLTALDYEVTGYMDKKLSEEEKQLPLDTLKKLLLKEATTCNEYIEKTELETLSIQQTQRLIEKIRNDHKEEELTAGIFVSGNDKQEPSYTLLSTRFRSKTKELLVPNPNTGKTIPLDLLLYEDSQNTIALVTNTHLAHMDPLIVGGQNQITYDYRQMNKLTGAFRPGLDFSHTEFKSQIPGGFSVNTGLKGRQSLDTNGYGRNFVMSHSHRLDQLNNIFTGTKAQKTENYDTLERKSVIILTENEERAQKEFGKTVSELSDEGNFYTVQDGLKSYSMCQEVLEEHLQLSNIADCDIATLDMVALRTITIDYWTNQHFEKHGSYPETPLQWAAGKIKGKKEKFEGFDGLKTFLTHELNTKKGLYEQANSTEIFPLTNIFYPLLKQDPAIVQAIEFAKKENKPHKTSRILTFIEHLAQYPYFELSRQDRNEKDFEQLFLTDEHKGHAYLTQRVKEHQELFEHILEQATLINRNKKSFIFEQEISYPPWIVNKGQGRALSGETEKYATGIEQLVTLYGIAAPLSNKGEKNTFEKHMLDDLFSNLLLQKDTLHTLEHLHEQIQTYHAGRIAQEQLRYVRVARRNWTDYNSNAKQGWIQQAIEQKANIGDIIQYTYSKEELDEKMFGLATQEQLEQIKQRNTHIAEVKEERRKGYDAHIDSESYPKPVIKEGSIAGIIKWMSNYAPSNPNNELIEQFFRGQSNRAHLTHLARDFSWKQTEKNTSAQGTLF